MKVTFNGKEVEVKEVQKGVVQKTDSIFYVQDSVTKEWLYCSPERLEKLRIKYKNDLSGYMGRNSRAEMKAAANKAKAEAPKPEKPEAPKTEKKAPALKATSVPKAGKKAPAPKAKAKTKAEAPKTETPTSATFQPTLAAQ